GTPEERRIQIWRHTLRAVVYVAFERNVPIAASPDWRNFVSGHQPRAGVINFLVLRSLRANRIENQLGAPRLQPVGNLVRIFAGVSRRLDCKRSQIAGSLMIPVPGVRASPTVHDNIRAYR